MIDKHGAEVVAEKILRCLKWHYGAEPDTKDDAAKQLIAELIWDNSTPLTPAECAEIERLRAALNEIISIKDDTLGSRRDFSRLSGQEHFDRGARMAFYRCATIAQKALSPAPGGD
jgi:hypothetical protein